MVLRSNIIVLLVQFLSLLIIFISFRDSVGSLKLMSLRRNVTGIAHPSVTTLCCFAHIKDPGKLQLPLSGVGCPVSPCFSRSQETTNKVLIGICHLARCSSLEYTIVFSEFTLALLLRKVKEYLFFLHTRPLPSCPCSPIPQHLLKPKHTLLVLL